MKWMNIFLKNNWVAILNTLVHLIVLGLMFKGLVEKEYYTVIMGSVCIVLVNVLDVKYEILNIKKLIECKKDEAK